MLINNAGIQRMIDLKKGRDRLQIYLRSEVGDEIDINFKAYVHMSAHFIGVYLKEELGRPR